MRDTKTMFGMRVKELRKSSGFSQDQLAEKVGISPKYLSRIEMGEHFPSLDVLIRLSGSLRVELKDLFEFFHETPSQRELKENLDTLIKGG